MKSLEGEMLVVWILRHYEMYFEQLSQQERSYERSLFTALRQHIEANAVIFGASDTAMRTAIERERAELIKRIGPLMLPVKGN